MSETQTITVKEVKLAIRACAEHTRRASEAAAAEEVKKSAMLGVFERLLGIKNANELASLDPDDIRKIAKARIKRGELELEGFILEELMKVIQLSATRRNVSWKEAFVAELGASKAAKLQEMASPTHSYKFVEAELGAQLNAAEAVSA